MRSLPGQLHNCGGCHFVILSLPVIIRSEKTTISWFSWNSSILVIVLHNQVRDGWQDDERNRLVRRQKGVGTGEDQQKFLKSKQKTNQSQLNDRRGWTKQTVLRWEDWPRGLACSSTLMSRQGARFLLSFWLITDQSFWPMTTIFSFQCEFWALPSRKLWFSWTLLQSLWSGSYTSRKKTW